MHAIKLLALVPCILLALTSCSSSGGDDDESSTDTSTDNGDDTTNGVQLINQIGFIEVEYFDQSNETDLFGGFIQTSESATLSFVLSDLENDRAEGCEITVQDLSVLDDEDISLPDYLGTYEYISAGDSIVFTSPAGTWAEISKAVIGDLVAYTTENLAKIAGTIPDGLTFTIPGDEFSAFQNIPVSTVPALDVTSSTPGMVSTETSWSWTPSGNENARVNIYTALHDFELNTVTTVDCYAADDGNFSFPDATKAELGSEFSPFEESVFIERTVLEIHQSGPSLLLVNN